MRQRVRGEETVGVRYTGRAALDRDPQNNSVEFVCPHCHSNGAKPARHERTSYHFTDGFVQDLEGETTKCRNCRTTLRIVPVVMLHDWNELERFRAIYPAGTPAKN
jgi:hypothetical protein